jgi:hypothetical protein
VPDAALAGELDGLGVDPPPGHDREDRSTELLERGGPLGRPLDVVRGKLITTARNACTSTVGAPFGCP